MQLINPDFRYALKEQMRNPPVPRECYDLIHELWHVRLGVRFHILEEIDKRGSNIEVNQA